MLFSSCKEHTYKVVITECNTNIKDTVFIASDDGAPTSNNISTYNQAVPSFRNRLNVCNVETIKQID